MHSAPPVSRLPCVIRALTRRSTSARSKLTADDLLIMFRKLGAKFTQKDLDTLMKQLDPSGDGTCSFKEFAVGLASADRSKLGGLADVFKCAPLRVSATYARTCSPRACAPPPPAASRRWRSSGHTS